MSWGGATVGGTTNQDDAVTDLPITMDSLSTIAGIIVGCFGLAATVGGAVLKAGASLRKELAGQIEAQRSESTEGRKRMHQRIDDLRQHIDANFVSRDRYEADQRAVQHALTETQQIVSIATRPCAARPD